MNAMETLSPINKSDKTNSTKHAPAPINFSTPMQVIDMEHHMDPHHAGDDEKAMAITLPRLIRIVIILFLVIVVI
ncbi:MAG: hypothetical protein JWQ38_2351 [Flavipsychrobacter sp.]|nr:hypothetical protein [Flavipsychrobacter sp.]